MAFCTSVKVVFVFIPESVSKRQVARVFRASLFDKGFFKVKNTKSGGPNNTKSRGTRAENTSMRPPAKLLRDAL